jgi:hypothetical protein
MLAKYCDHCQLLRKDCDKDARCMGAMEREYARNLAKWEASSDYVEGSVY